MNPLNLLKPGKLQEGDRVATITLSWGGAGQIPGRYRQGKLQLENTFGLEVVETPNALKPADWIYRNPEARAEDLNEAFRDPTVKAIISNIGGEDSVRILPWIDFDLIRSHPKILMGYSDTTVSLFAVLRAGVVPFYGPSVLAGFAENGGIFPYVADSFRSRCFQTEAPSLILPNEGGWTNEHLDWADESLLSTRRKLYSSSGWRWLQGAGIASGHLMGGCLDVLEFIKGSPVWPSPEEWKGAVLFFETSEEKMPPHLFKWIIRNYGAQGILQSASGVLLGRPYNDTHFEAYDAILLQVIQEELGLDIPIISGMDFGHSEPMMTLPIGMTVELDCENQKIRLMESGVV